MNNDASRERDWNALSVVTMVIRPAATTVTIRPFHSHRQFFASPKTLSRTMSQFYNLKAKLPGDKDYDFEQLKGKVVLVVNVASKW